MEYINQLEAEILELKNTLHIKEKELYEIKQKLQPLHFAPEENGFYVETTEDCNTRVQMGSTLPKWAIERYSRQILLPDIGVQGQAKLMAAKVLVVGAGGLGCPASVYLAGAGVGEIGIVDYDKVDLTNIHRQILHGERDEHISKAESAASSLRSINSHIKITPYNIQLDSTNALEVASQYDIILDCTDNVPTRYLLNDVAVLTKVPLISGSALKMEGQLSIFGYTGDNSDKECGPCYRCVFPSPPPPEAVGSCSANGVAGPVPGTIGALQALEAIKLIVGRSRESLLVEKMLLFDGDDMTFRTVKLRPRNPQCDACSANPTITNLIDYEGFCKAQAKEKKKEEARLKSQRRKEEKVKRMSGQSYFGFRKSSEKLNKWVQDVPKSGRKLRASCTSSFCTNTSKACSEITIEERQKIFNDFWKMDWKNKKNYVRSLVDTLPPKRRRVKEDSRRGDTKYYHLIHKGERKLVCRTMFYNTLDIKDATVRYWLSKDKPKRQKKPLKTLNVVSYIENLPISTPKCPICMDKYRYININHIKNQFQLYNQYVKDVKSAGESPASRKTFTKVIVSKNLRIFRPKNSTDVCDVYSEHNLQTNGLNDKSDCYYNNWLSIQ